MILTPKPLPVNQLAVTVPVALVGEIAAGTAFGAGLTVSLVVAAVILAIALTTYWSYIRKFTDAEIALGDATVEYRDAKRRLGFSRSELVVEIPKGLPLGTYDKVRLRNPQGDSVVLNANVWNLGDQRTWDNLVSGATVMSKGQTSV